MPKKIIDYYCYINNYGKAIQCACYGCKQNVRYFPYFMYDNIYRTSCNKSGLNGTKEYYNRLLYEARKNF